MKILTISRTFGSGGRELGRLLAERLGFDYYDREIIERIAGASGLHADYVARALEQGSIHTIPLTFGRSFTYASSVQGQKTELLLAERKVIEEIAKAGRDCVIVGRNADVLLTDHDPFCVFVTADREMRIKRCMERVDGDVPTRREIESQMRLIDKNRMHMRDLIAESKWGDPAAYHVTVNTSTWELPALADGIVAMAQAWWTVKK